MSLIISRPIVQVREKSVAQPKVPGPKTSRIHDKIVPIPDYAIPHISSGDDLGSRMVKRKTIEDVRRANLVYPDQVYRPPPKPVKLPIPKVLKAR